MPIDFPKDPLGNAEHRKRIWALGARAGASRGQIKDFCRADPLFWINSFCHLFEPRRAEDLPFITWPCQDEALLKANQCIQEHRDMVAVKARDMGFTWIIIALFVWRWQFLPRQALGVCSRTDELVWKTGDSDALFTKIESLLNRQPKWLLPVGFDWRKHFLKKQLINPELGCEIKGYTTTGDIARGGRRLAILADELAAFEFNQGRDAMKAMQGATDTVIAISTPQGQIGAFFEAWKRSQSGGYHRKVVGHQLHWSEHPLKRPGLYTTREGKIEVLDREYKFPEDYPFRLDREGKVRSPAYDGENERKSDQYMAEEWDLDFAGAGSVFFQPDYLDKAERDFCRPPLRTGRLSYDPVTMEPRKWMDDPKGPVKLWCQLIGGKPVPSIYVSGHDVSSGTGATPSTVCVENAQTGEQAAEYADARRSINDFARDSIALAKWFHDARMIWEKNGPGLTFQAEVMLSSYRNLYCPRTNEFGLSSKPTDSPGWGSNRQLKRELLESFRDGLGTEFVPRSEALIGDARGYVYSIGGGVDHEGSIASDDNSAASENHGDRLIAAALAHKVGKAVRKSQGKVKNAEPKQKILPGSVAWMIEEEKRQREEAEITGGLNL